MKEEAERDDRYQGRQKKRRRNGWAARASPGRAQRDAVRATRRRRLLAAIVATSSPRPPRTASAKSQQKRRAAVGTRPTNTRPEKAPSTRSANVGHHGEQHSAQPPNASESHGKLHSAAFQGWASVSRVTMQRARCEVADDMARLGHETRGEEQRSERGAARPGNAVASFHGAVDDSGLFL
uniref:Uncharacterized protein LOC116951124 isoform X3 n=1 Tax=Petromyzon marinus TaxID=7757 RepID=A0AAJ7TWF3_PETMA|nr:uncharacterized protein LOC116951124 isoform X3 [Petromyzon marinus]